MILTRLSEATGHFHDAMERRLPLFHDAFTRDYYRGLLGRFLGFYSPWEERLLAQPWPPAWEFEFGKRRKIPLLIQDLTALGLVPAELAQLPRCEGLPQITTQAQALGCWYVLEGATLGNQVIARHLRAKLSFTPETGLAYFHGYGPETGARWQAFTAILRTAAAALAADDEIVATARQTQATWDLWLAGPPAARAESPRCESAG
jgi:heme oxygenase